MRPQNLLAALLLFCLAASSLLPATLLADSVKVKELLKQRRDVLVAQVEAIEQEIELGIAEDAQARLIDARDELLLAQIELADTKVERIRLLEARVANLKQGEEQVAQARQFGAANPIDVLSAKAKRLSAEIDLQRALDAE